PRVRPGAAQAGRHDSGRVRRSYRRRPERPRDAGRGSAHGSRPHRARRHARRGAESVSRALAGSEVMPLPWLQIIDAVVGVTNFARSRRAGIATDDQRQQQQMETAARTPGGLEARMAGVVVAALKEAFDRDTRRLELERDQLAAERERAERALRLELQRQAADREIGRLRMLAGVAIAGWLVTLLLAIWPGSRLVATIGARVALGAG